MDKISGRVVVDTPFKTQTVISYGLMVYAVNTARWLIVQRKHSAEYILFLTGNYRRSYLPFLLSRITKAEYDKIVICVSQIEAFDELYLIEHQLEIFTFKYAKTIFMENLTLIKSLLTSVVLGTTLQWTWPKGRLQSFYEKENPILCAKREFVEEVEIELPKAVYISKHYITNVFKTINQRLIETRLWLYVIDEEITIPALSNRHLEVGDRKWASNLEVSGLLHIDVDFLTTVMKFDS